MRTCEGKLVSHRQQTAVESLHAVKRDMHDAQDLSHDLSVKLFMCAYAAD